MHFFFRVSVNAPTQQLREWASWSFSRFNRTLVKNQPRSAVKSLVCKRLGLAQWLGIPNHCSWSAHCAASLSLPSRSPSSPLPSMSSPSSSTVASVGLSSFSIFCIPSKDFWSLGSRLQGGRETNTHLHKEVLFNRACSRDTVRREPSPERYTVLIHGFLVIVDSHQEISQHPVQDAVALIGQGAAEERDSFFIFLFPTFMRNRPALECARPSKAQGRFFTSTYWAVRPSSPRLWCSRASGPELCPAGF